ncbi:hypothetical protein AB8B12_33760, partial [Streptomyces sp. PGLac3x]
GVAPPAPPPRPAPPPAPPPPPARAAGVTAPFELDENSRWRLLNGLDDISITLREEEAIAAYESGRPAFKPRTLPV